MILRAAGSLFFLVLAVGLLALVFSPLKCSSKVSLVGGLQYFFGLCR